MSKPRSSRVETQPEGGPGKGSSPYATGGGGVVFEHEFGATLLAALLLGSPVPGLGDDLAVESVGFQASQFSPVDDLMVRGRARGGGLGAARRLFIGVRRNPQIVPSSKEFVSLLVDYLQATQKEWQDIVDGSLCLGLVVAKRNRGIEELDALAVLAQGQPGSGEFRDAISAPGRFSGRVRERLAHLDAAVAKAAQQAAIKLPPGGTTELTWRLLRALRVIESRLEGSTAADRTGTVRSLTTLAGESQKADSLFTALSELAAHYAPVGAVVTESMLRSKLRGHANVGRSPSYKQSWELLDLLGQQVRSRTRRELSSPSPPRQLVIARADLQRRLAASMRSAGEEGTSLIVTGAPDVGKSVLALAAADELGVEVAAVTTLNLRDLPLTPVEISTLLGTSLATLLGGGRVAGSRLIVVDGAEAVLEGRFDSLRYIAESAAAAGLGLIAIARSDASEQVKDAITVPGASKPAPLRFDVPGLSDGEIAQVVTCFPELSRISRDPRSMLLLARPGLVDLLLRADATAVLPDGAQSEADVFNAVWEKLVRLSERHDPGAGTPDGREAELLNLARRELGIDYRQPVADAHALPSLRSDGLLLRPSRAAAWSRGDDFASDLIRDFSVARVLIVDGLEILRAAEAPRWSLRAARLACQALLASEGAHVEVQLDRVGPIFNALASDFGERWADLPLESLLTLGSPNLERIWTRLLANGAEGLDRLLRIVEQRFTEGGIADPVLAEPVVQQLFQHEDALAGLSYDTRQATEKLQLRWLRGLAATARADTPNRLRAEIRDRLLASDPSRYDERVNESLAILGPDLNEATESYLRRLAADAPHELAPCVDSSVAALSMAIHHPDLLLELAECYYIDDRTPRGLGLIAHDGIRDHHRRGGFGQPMAAWWYGPFFHLLQVRTKQAVAFINRMLDHAARYRTTELSAYGPPVFDVGPHLPTGEDSLPGIEADIPGVGRRFVIGDDHVWAWYRGTTVGPRSCMSALLALERFIEWIYAKPADLERTVNLLLGVNQSMAMEGLVVGFLLRHLQDVDAELDSWLAEPAVWELEFSRLAHESGLTAAMVRGTSPDDPPPPKSIIDAAGELLLQAIAAGNFSAVTRLSGVADQLERRAAAYYSSYLAVEELERRVAAARRWASFLRATSLGLDQFEGKAAIRYKPPEGTEKQASERADFERGTELLRLFNAYATVSGRQATDTVNLPADLDSATLLSDDLPATAEFVAGDALAAIAATAVIAFADGRMVLSDNQLQWAAQVVVQAALSTPTWDAEDPGIHDSGADRSAAYAVPSLLLPAFIEDRPSWLTGEDFSIISDALQRLCTSSSGEVRRRAATSLDPVWWAPCTARPGGGEVCRHAVALEAIKDATRRCRMGPFDMAEQRRNILPLEGDLCDSLDQVSANDLLVARLVPPLIAACAVVSSPSCVASQARTLRDALLRAHARAAVHWMGEHHQLDQTPEGQQMLAEAIFKVAAEGEPEVLLDYRRALESESGAHSVFLHGLAVAVTYSTTLRVALQSVWPALMAEALDAVDQGRLGVGRPENRDHDDEQTIASLLPTPRIRFDDPDIDTTLNEARVGWIGVETLGFLLERWLKMARGRPGCVDSLVSFLQTLAPSVQVTPGLDWIAQAIDGRFGLVAGRTYQLIGWLDKLKDADGLKGDSRRKYQVIVDGLAANGDNGAVRLQKALE